jgi:hypothetical protein
MKKLLSLFAAAALLCAMIPADAQVPPGLMRFGTTGAFAPQVGNCLSIMAMNSSGQVATDSQVPCSPSIITVAYTNATTSFTPILSLAPVQGSTALRGECTLTYQDSSTSGTATFAIGLSAAPTNLWVTSTPTTGTFVAPTFTTITSTTITAVTSALVTTTANAPYQAYLSFSLVNGTAPTTLTVYAQTNGTGTVSVLPGSACSYIV